MKKILFLVLAGAAAYYYFVMSRQIDEQMVRDFYSRQNAAILNLDDKALCEMMDATYRHEETMNANGETSTVAMNKDESCKAGADSFGQLRQLRDRLGGKSPVEFEQTIQSIEISSDKKSATVVTKARMDIGGTLMQTRTEGTETLIRKDGKVLTTGSVAKSRIFTAR